MGNTTKYVTINSTPTKRHPGVETLPANSLAEVHAVQAAMRDAGVTEVAVWERDASLQGPNRFSDAVKTGAWIHAEARPLAKKPTTKAPVTPQVPWGKS